VIYAENVRYEQPGVAVTAGQFHLAVKLRCLWDSSLCVNDISLRDIYVAIDTRRCRQLRRSKKRTAGR
jgi:translocation and assembly module TamB